MTFVTQLLPGLREVRAPLIAGYLWIFASWLLLAGELPTKHDPGVYAHAFEVGDVVGRIGLIAVVSVAAYLVGSLLQAVPRWVAYNAAIAARWLKRRSSGPTSNQALSSRNALDLVDSPPFYAPADFHELDGDPRTAWVLEELFLRRLGKSRRILSTVLVEARREIRRGAENTGSCSAVELTAAAPRIEIVKDREDGWGAQNWGATIGDQARMQWVGTSLPSFSAARDIFGERRAIQTRLMETAKHAGSEVERLYSESDFRFTVAPPIAAVAIILAAESADLWWLLFLVAATGLLTHAMVLRKHAGRELAEALRSRPTFEELDQITPAFTRYEQDVNKIVHKLARTNWRKLGELAKSDPNRKATQPDS